MEGDSKPKPIPDVVRAQRNFAVHPLQWTSRHLELLGCRFEDVATTPVCPEAEAEAETETENEHSNSDSRESSQKTTDAEVLAKNPFPVRKRRCLSNILLGEGSEFAYTRYELPSIEIDLSIGVTDIYCTARELHFIFEVGQFIDQPISCSIATKAPSVMAYSRW